MDGRLDLADTVLALGDPLEDAKARGLGEGLEEVRLAFEPSIGPWGIRHLMTIG